MTPMKLEPKTLSDMLQNGFCAIPKFLDRETLHTLRDYYDKILNQEISLGKNDRLLGGAMRQVMVPSKSIAYFKENPAVRSGLEVAQQIFGGRKAEP